MLFSSLIVASGATKLLLFVLLLFGVEEVELLLDAVELDESDELREHDDISEHAWLMFEARTIGFDMPF